MTTSVTVSRTSADKVIHRGVITNMCTQAGHSGQSGVFTIFIVPILHGAGDGGDV